jgi:signal transduction histidine kinase
MADCMEGASVANRRHRGKLPRMEPETTTLHHLLESGRRLLSVLDPEAVFEQVLEEARLITGARFAALGVLNESRTELDRFLTSGLDAEAHARIGQLPRGRGVLGALIEDPQPLRLADVASHPQSLGFPAAHPDMASFLGVPILIRGRAWGNLYLTEKDGGLPFTQADEDGVGVLAQFAAIAIDNARLFQRSERGRLESIQALRGLEAARTISDAIGTGVELNTILELVVKRGRSLIGARSVMIMLAQGGQLELVAGTGTTADRRGTLYDLAGSASGRVLTSGVPLRVNRVADGNQELRDLLGVGDMRTALIVPMIHRGHGVGVLIGVDRGSEQGPFTDADEDLLMTFGAAAANAVAISRSVESDRLAATIDAAEAERRRWARELHDQTLQSLGGLRILLSGARRRDDIDLFRTSVSQAIGDLEYEISNLRGIIADLRPPLLDDLGLQDALSALINRHRDRGLYAMLVLDLIKPDGEELVLTPELETTVYRLIQEALTNVVKHAQAHSVAVDTMVADRDTLIIEVRDDGVGFDPSVTSAGFGMSGMRERTYLAGGSLKVTSSPAGTIVRMELPSGYTSLLGDRHQRVREP